MAFPTIAAEAVTTPVLGDPVDLAVPAHNSGDRLVLVFTTDGSPVINGLGGVNGVEWTQRVLQSAQQGVTRIAVYELWATSDQATPTTVSLNLGAARPVLARCWRITGSHATQALEAATATGGATTTKDPPSLTASWGAEDNLWFAYGNHDGDSSTSAFTGDPANYTILGTDEYVSATDGVEHRIGWRQLNAATEDPGAYTISSGIRGVSATLAIRPAAASGTDVTVATTLDGLTASASAAQSVDLTASVTLAGLTAAGQLAQAFDVTVSAQLEGLLVAAQAASGTSVDVTVSTTLDGLTASVTAAQAVDLTADITLDGLTAAAQLAQAVSVTVSAALDGLEVDAEASSQTPGATEVAVQLDGVEVSAAVQQAVSVAVSVALEGLAAEAGLDLTEIRFTFTPPTRGPRSQIMGPVVSSRRRAWRRFINRVNEVEYGTNVWRAADGTWHEGIVDTSDDTHLAVYLGGKTHEVTEAEKVALEAAGYTVVTE